MYNIPANSCDAVICRNWLISSQTRKSYFWEYIIMLWMMDYFQSDVLHVIRGCIRICISSVTKIDLEKLPSGCHVWHLNCPFNKVNFARTSMKWPFKRKKYWTFDLRDPLIYMSFILTEMWQRKLLWHQYIKMLSWQYWNFHYKDKTVSWLSHLYNGNHFIG